MGIKLFINGIYIPETEFFVEREAVKIEKWYDRSRREWVIYPVDKDGNQLTEASYGFSKAEAEQIKKELEKQYGV